MAREATYKPTTYLRINAEGQLYNGTSEPAEGYVQYTSKQGNVSYRKVFSGTEYGKITQLGISEKTYESGKVKFVEIVVENDEARDIIQLPLKKQNGTLTDEVRKLVSFLPNVDFNKTLTITSNRKKNDRGYVDKVLFFSYVDEGGEFETIKSALKFGEGGDIPMFTTKEGLDGIVYDYTEQDRFLYGKLLDELTRFQEFKSSPKSSDVKNEEKPKKEEKPSETKTTSKSTKKEEPKVEDDDDDLPF